MAKMTEEAKLKLREAVAKKRLTHPKAKDYAVDEWLIHLDKAQDELAQMGFAQRVYDAHHGWEHRWYPGGYGAMSKYARKWTVGITLKYVSDEVIEALAKRLHGIKVRYTVGPERVRETYVLPYNVTAQLLRTLRLADKYDSIRKYATEWTVKSIQACRIKIK